MVLIVVKIIVCRHWRYPQIESEIRLTWRKICTLLVHYDHEIVLEGLKQPNVVCAIVLFVCEGQVGKSGVFYVIMVSLWSIY
jgi:hypothetical protein